MNKKLFNVLENQKSYITKLGMYCDFYKNKSYIEYDRNYIVLPTVRDGLIRNWEEKIRRILYDNCYKLIKTSMNIMFYVRLGRWIK